MDGRFFVLVTTIVTSMAYMNNPLDRKKVDCKPEQVHIAFGDSLTDMVVVWSTLADCNGSTVQYGKRPWGFDKQVPAKTVFFQDIEGFGVPYLHRAVLQNLEQSMNYFYTVVSDQVSSEPYFFETPSFGSDWSPEFLVYGDLGIHSDNIPLLTTEARKGIYTAVLHVGDFGYNLEDLVQPANSNTTDLPDLTEKLDNVGDIFMRDIEGMAAYVPYMTSPGNHEIDDDTFNQYRHRFSMPNTDWPMPVTKLWYSLDIGPVHFLSYSSEVFFTQNGMLVQSQRDWIVADLNAANQNRQRCPWIIAFGHRPMYCSNDDNDDCTKEDSLVREGFEDLFFEQGVDIVLQAHEHSYERLWPMFKGVVLATNYSNPPAPVQIVTGAAGSKHGIDMMNPVNHTWSAFRMDDRAYNSYGRLEVKNRTHVHWQQIAVQDNTVLDAVWITQESHGPFHQENLEPEVKQKISEQIQHDNEAKKEKQGPSTKDTNSVVSKPASSSTGQSVASKAWDMLNENKIKVAIGVSCGVFVVLLIVIVCLVRRCRRKPRSYRRWETLDYGKKFYSTVKNSDKDMDDFEVDVSDGTTKLLTSNGLD